MKNHKNVDCEPIEEITIGRFTICRAGDPISTKGNFWIYRDGGEGSEFSEKLFEEHIAVFFKKYF